MGDRKGSETSGIPRSAIEDTLTRLLADSAFQVSERNKRFLRFVVEKELEGEGGGIRAYAIATTVFGRPKDFDAALDPIVRIEATRLRTALKHYYETHGRDEAIRIDLPKGGYAPSFSPRLPDARPHEEAYGQTAGGQMRVNRWLWRLNRKSAAIAIGILVLAGSVFLMGWAWAYSRFNRPIVLQKPLLIIEVISNEGASSSKADEFKDALMASFVRFERWRIADGSKQRGTAVPPFHTYKLDLRIRPDAGGNAIWWQLTDADSAELLRSDVIRGEGAGGMQDYTGAIQELADWLGGSRGLINSVEISRFGEQVPLGYGCIAWMEAEIWLWDRARLSGVRECLEKSLKIEPDDPEYSAALARVLMRSESFDGPQPLTKRALDLAERAAHIAPYSSQAIWALSIASQRNGNRQQAALLARRALALNPDDLTLRSFAGVILFLTGAYDEGVSLIMASDNGRVPLSVESYIVLALDSYRRGDYAQVLERTQPTSGPRCFCALAARAVAFAKLGRMDEATAELENLRTLRPTVAADFSEAMSNRGIPSEITVTLRDHLDGIGFNVQ